MSIYNRIYLAKVAPASETWRDAIHHGIDVVDEGRRWTESFATGAFIRGGEPAPVVLAHDDGKPIGKVVGLISHGDWHVASFTLDHSKPMSAVALDRLRVGAPVSIGAKSLSRDKLLEEEGVRRHTVARLEELVVLAPNQLPGYRGAQVTQILEPSKPKPSSAPPTRGSTSTSTAVPAGHIVRRASRRPTPAEEDAELRRRWEWAADRDIRFEDVLEGMKLELGYSSAGWWKR